MSNTRTHYTPSTVALAISCLPAIASAFSYMPMPDAALYDQASTIVLATVTDVTAAQDSGLPATRYRMRVDERIKGRPTEDVVVSVAGGTVDGATLVVSGAPHFTATEQVLVFLGERGDGTYGVTQLALGAFKVRRTVTGRTVVIRDLADAHAFAAPGVNQVDRDAPQRDLEAFKSWLRERGRGAVGPGDYFLGDAEQLIDPPGAKYLLASSPPVRWSQFDEGRTVPFHAGVTGITNLLGGGYAQLQQALAAWNDDADSNVRFVYGGTTSASGGLSAPDGVSTILFNDPDDLIGGIFDCLRGGVMATTGTWVGSTRTWRGGSYVPIVEADIVVQDGVSCLLGLAGNANAAELFTHELGHALGLAHSCGDAASGVCVAGTEANDAVMRTTLHTDGRGAGLGTDDRAGIRTLYPTATAPSTGAPAPQTSPTASGGGSLAVSTLVALLLAAGLRPRRGALMP